MSKPIKDKNIIDINQLFDFNQDYIKFFINSAILKGFMLNKKIENVIKEELEKKIDAKHPKFLTVYKKLINTYRVNEKVFWQINSSYTSQTKSKYDKEYNNMFQEYSMPFSVFMGIVDSIVKYTHKSSYDVIKNIAFDMNLQLASLIKAQGKPHTYIIERIDDNYSNNWSDSIHKDRLSRLNAHPVLHFLDNPLGYLKDKSLLKNTNLLKPNISFKLVDIQNRQID